MTYHIFPKEIMYQSIANYANSHPIPLPSKHADNDMAPVWRVDSTLTIDFLDIGLPSEKEL